MERVLNGSKVMLERLEMPKKTESGIVLPSSYVNDKEDVNKTLQLDPYQKRGRIMHIGIACSELFRENFKVGDIVHFGPNSYMPVPLDKEVMQEDTPYVLIDEWSIDWKDIEVEEVLSSK